MLDLIEYVILDLLLIVLAGDLLYLYFIGWWYDPQGFISLWEIICLTITILFALLRLWRDFRKVIQKH